MPIRRSDSFRSIDREVAASYNITIRATSSDSSSSASTRTITIGDVDEFNTSAVTDLAGVVNSVVENASVGTVGWYYRECL